MKLAVFGQRPGPISKRTKAALRKKAASETLVVDRSFEIKTSDPQRAFEPTAAIVDRGVYDTLFTYRGGDLAHPGPAG